MPRAGAVIYAVRKMRGMKMEDFVSDLGFKVPTLNRLERDDPRIDIAKVARAAEKLGLELNWETRQIELPPYLSQKVFESYEAKLAASAAKFAEKYGRPDNLRKGE